MFHMGENMRRTARNNTGFTLLESLIAASVLALSITAITLPFTAAAQTELEEARRTISLCLAREMIEEIISVDFYDPDGPSTPGPESSEYTRWDFDNIDDYNGYSETGDAIVGLDGEALTGLAAKDLTRSVTVEYVYVDGQPTTISPTFVRITVEVAYEGNVTASVTRLVYARDSIVEEG